MMARLTRKPCNAGVYAAARQAHEREIAKCEANKVPPNPGVVQRLEQMRIGETIDTRLSICPTMYGHS